jgi:DNA-directed RNA polymerase specialized sigma subunit
MNGEKREQIAKDLGISIRPVCQVAEKNNIYRIKKQERDEKIINLYSKGFQLKDIANQFNISEATVLRVIKQHNKDYNSKLY